MGPSQIFDKEELVRYGNHRRLYQVFFLSYPNPKLSPTWERGTIVQRGITGTNYKVD
jgi:hypothetical protein